MSSSSSSSSCTLITFDVDGTLVHGSGRAASESVHARAFSHAVATVCNHGKPVAPVAQALPRRLYHGSTDGLILLRLVQATCGNRISPQAAFAQLDKLMDCMYEYVMTFDDDAITEHIQPLPGVLEHLQTLAARKDDGDESGVYCGLVTGNVEGIARRKIKAVGVWDTGALGPPCRSQLQKWTETTPYSFLGGFGSDYCSGDVQNLARNHLDRAQQIVIATERCRRNLATMSSAAPLRRVVHVGDAPADVLAAKAFAEYQQNKDENEKLTVGMVAVATGSYSAEELKELCGKPIPGQWEPVVLEDGMASPDFLKACGI